MITEVTIENFKLFEEVTFKLDDAIVLAGPNNSGKSTLLQTIATWYLGSKRWLQERGEKPPAKRKTGVPITRKEFTVVPLREMNLLWTDRRTGAAREEGIKPGTPNLIKIGVKGTRNSKEWEWPMEFQYATQRWYTSVHQGQRINKRWAYQMKSENYQSFISLPFLEL